MKVYSHSFNRINSLANRTFNPFRNPDRVRTVEKDNNKLNEHIGSVHRVISEYESSLGYKKKGFICAMCTNGKRTFVTGKLLCKHIKDNTT